MNLLDQSILHYVNGFAQHCASFDNCLACLQNNDLFKGGVVIPVLWWLWFSKDEQVREYIISTVAASFAAIFLARVLALLLPFRQRPIFNSHLHFIAPFGGDPGALLTWSAFPSDHAAFFFAVATGIAMVSRKVGALLILYTFLGICLPRMYFGFHHPTDIIAGAGVGVAAVIFACSEKPRKKLSFPFLKWEREQPAFFYAASFLITFQMGILFNSIRELIKSLKDLVVGTI